MAPAAPTVSGKPDPGTPDSRSRLVSAMVDALQRRGLHGTGVADLLALAQAPKGVLYHHFPGGKNELAVAAVQAIAERICASLDAAFAAEPDPRVGLRTWVAQAQRRLAASAFGRGCPLATVALETTPDDVALRAALAEGFSRIRARIAGAWQAAGRPAAEGEGIAALVVSAYEGGLMQARVAGDAGVLIRTAETLLALLPGAEPRRTT